MSEWPSWHGGTVRMMGVGSFPALVSSVIRNGWCTPRFARPQVERIVEEVQREFADGDGTGVTMGWNPADADELIVRQATGTHPIVTTVRADADGLWTLRWNDRPWSVQAEEWTEAVRGPVAELIGSSWVGGLAMAWRRALMRMDHIGAFPDELPEASAACERAERVFLSALLAHGVRIGHLEQVARTVFDSTSAVLPHTNLIVPRPGFQVTGITPVEGGRRAFVATVDLAGETVGFLHYRGVGHAVEYTPTAGELREGLEQMAAFRAASCLPTGRPGDLTFQRFFNLLLTEYVQAQQVSAYTSKAPQTVLRTQDPEGADGDFIYVVLATGPGEMRRQMPVTPGLTIGRVLRHGTEGEYWTGKGWRPVTFVMRAA